LVALLVGVALSNPRFQKIAEEVNRRNVGWKAEYNPRFNPKQMKFGWNGDLERRLPAAEVDRTLQLPANFNSSANWPKCSTISTIYNQADCGSCWAFGGTESAADRFCIATNGQFNQPLSFAQMTECNNEADGCEGGSAQAAMDFISSPGLVTASCYPYYIPTCPPPQQPCLNFVNTPNCWTNNTCVDGTQWTSYQYSNTYQYMSVSDIMTGIMQSGPVEACFSVYEDFLTYKSGVYEYTTGAYLGGHCIKILGWGVTSDGTEYWQCNNQWTTYWGNEGTFLIQRGVDMVGIEDSVYAGDASVN